VQPVEILGHSLLVASPNAKAEWRGALCIRQPPHPGLSPAIGERERRSVGGVSRTLFHRRCRGRGEVFVLGPRVTIWQRDAVGDVGPGLRACEGIERWLDRHGASFETAALRLPQDEAVSKCYQ
jgi:hypothetical protein